MLDLLAFVFLGIAMGAAMGIAPGIHPNMILLAIPLLMSLEASAASLTAFMVALGVANAFVDFIPSLLFGAPDSESGLATLPGHRMLLKGMGYQAVRHAVSGGLLSVVFCLASLPFLALAVPALYSSARPYTHYLLAVVVAILIATERSKKRMFWSAVCFALSGLIGLILPSLPIDRNLILFPVLAGFFGIPGLATHSEGISFPVQNFGRDPEGKSRLVMPPVLGSLGGILSGLLPGVGVGSIAAIATATRSDRAFLQTFGAIAVSNVLVSFLAIWLIGNPRSGVAVALEQLVAVDFGLFLLMAFSAALAAAISAPLALLLSRKTLSLISRLDYCNLNRSVLAILIFLVAAFTGAIGIVLMLTCTALGFFAGRMKIKRGILMGVLIVPSMLYFALAQSI